MCKIDIVAANIVDDNLLAAADAVVNAANPQMRYGSGVCGAIFNKAGRERLERYIADTYGITDGNCPNIIKTGENRVTPGFNIPCDIIFAVAPRTYDFKNYPDAEALLLKTYENIAATAKARGYHKIIVPAMGTGSYGFMHDATAPRVVPLLKRLASENNVHIIFVVSGEAVAQIYKKYL